MFFVSAVSKLLLAVAILISTVLLVGCGGAEPSNTQHSATSDTTYALAIPANAELALVYQQTCMGCHASGLGKAPVTGDAKAWQVRFESAASVASAANAANRSQVATDQQATMDVLLEHTINGYGGMPPLGSCADCDLQELTALIRFMADPQAAGMSEVVALPAVTEVAGASDTAATTVATTNDAPTLTSQQEQQYRNYCSGCHAVGALDAPKTGDQQVWQSRLAKGELVLLNNTRTGLGYMPSMGGCNQCSDDDLLAIIGFMAGVPVVSEPTKPIQATSQESL